MNIVLDASAAIEMALNMKHASLFKEICANADCIFAPDIYPSEITNVFFRCEFKIKSLLYKDLILNSLSAMLMAMSKKQPTFETSPRDYNPSC